MSRPSTVALREASAWLVRLRDPNITAVDRDAFEAWLDSSPSNREAYELTVASVAGIESIGEDLRRELAAREAPDRPTVPRRGLIAVAASLCVAVIALGGLYFLNAPEEFSSEIGEQRTIALADGSEIELNTDTRISVKMDDDRRLVRLLSGEALFSVAADPERPFIVQVGEQRVRAVGTQFSVRREQDGLRVVVVEGVVAFEEEDAVMEVGAGHRLSAIGNAPEIQSVSTNETERALAWREGMLEFAGEPLSAAAQEIARHTGANFILEDEATRATPIWAYIRADDLDGFLSSLEQNVETLDVERQGNTVRIRSSM